MCHNLCNQILRKFWKFETKFAQNFVKICEKYEYFWLCSHQLKPLSKWNVIIWKPPPPSWLHNVWTTPYGKTKILRFMQTCLSRSGGTWNLDSYRPRKGGQNGQDFADIFICGKLSKKLPWYRAIELQSYDTLTWNNVTYWGWIQNYFKLPFIYLFAYFSTENILLLQSSMDWKIYSTVAKHWCLDATHNTFPARKKENSLTIYI